MVSIPLLLAGTVPVRQENRSGDPRLLLQRIRFRHVETTDWRWGRMASVGAPRAGIQSLSIHVTSDVRIHLPLMEFEPFPRDDTGSSWPGSYPDPQSHEKGIRSGVEWYCRSRTRAPP